MELVVTSLLVLVAIVVAIAVGYSTKISAYNNAVRRIAELYGGTFHPVGMFDATGPTARFDYHGTSAFLRLWTGRKSAPRTVQLQIAWPELQLDCEVVPRTFSRRFAGLFNGGDVQLGSAQFDGAFVVRGNSSREEICSQLDAGVQASLYRLKAIEGLIDLSVRWSQGALVIHGHGQVHEFARLRDFTSLGLALFDAVVTTSIGGITFVESAKPNSSQPWQTRVGADAGSVQVLEDHGRPPDTDWVVCPLCRDPLIVQIVHCRQCATPHHRECWRFHGACSVYGCGERHYVRALRRRRSPKNNEV